MGTRGAYGFRVDRQDKVTFNHWDSYPNCLGRKVMNYAADNDLETLRELARSIILVDSRLLPSLEMIEKYRKYADPRICEEGLDDWHSLLRKAQGKLKPYSDDLRHMIDSHEFLSDSVLCEWAYIINLDSEKLEIYKGYNRNSSAPGRYAKRKVKDSNGFHGVVLLEEVGIAKLNGQSIDELVKELEKTGKLIDQFG